MAQTKLDKPLKGVSIKRPDGSVDFTENGKMIGRIYGDPMTVSVKT